MPRYLVHYEGEGTGPRLIDPEPQEGDRLTFDGGPWTVQKIQAHGFLTGSAASGQVPASTRRFNQLTPP
jgi:hypothetical protein